MIASPALRRIVALALPLVALVAVYGAVVRPAARLIAEKRSATAQLADALDRYRQRAGRLPELTVRLAALRTGDSHADGFLAGDNEALAAAALQEHLKILVEQSQGKLASIEISPPQADDKRRRITARGEMNVGIAGLEKVLYAVETETPFLFVDTLSVHAVAAGGRGAAETEPLLDVRFDITGYMRGAG